MLLDALKEEISRLRFIATSFSAFVVAIASWLMSKAHELPKWKIVIWAVVIYLLVLIIMFIDKKMCKLIRKIKRA